jgi:ATP-binding cassette subfamily C protein LapB
MLEGLTKRSGTIVEIAVATFLTSLLAIGTSLFALQVYDKVVPSFAYSTLWALSGIVAILVFFDFCLRVIRSYLLDRLSTRLDEEVSTEIFKALGDVRLEARPKAIGALAAQIVGLDAARAFFTSSVLFTIAEIPFAALFIVVIGMLAGPIAYIYVVVAVFAIVVGVLAQMNVGRLSKQQLQNTYHRNGLLIEAITGVETIKALGAGWKFTKSWRTLTETISSLSLKSRMTLAVASSTAGALSSLAYVSVIVFGVYQIESGSLTVGGLIAATVLGGRVVSPIANGLNLLTQWHMANQSLRAVDGVLSLPRERRSDVELLSPSNLEASFLLENVRFYFDEAPIPTIEIPALTLSPGDRVLVVGAPGSGKSTLMRVLAGLYQPSAGRVLLGGVDIAMLDPELIRSKVAFLPQEIHLFKGTLRENLCLGGAPDDSALVKVVGMLGLDAAVAEHPRGLDRPISEGGGGLSVGQKQLCGVARLLLRRPKIWLMDEPSSALDAATEKKMYAAIEAALDPADILVIVTHRSASVPFCERVLVMQQGRIVIDEKRADLNDRMRLQAREASTL